MISIGLIGAPRAGKSLLAQAVQVKMPDLWIVDGYADFVKEHDRPLGNVADYDTHLWLYFHRYAAEQHHCMFDESFISCGTAVDNIAHAGVTTETIARAVQTEHSETRVMRSFKATEILACLLVDRLKYDHLFYLPVTTGDLFSIKIDNTINEVLSRFNLSSIPALEGSVDEMTAKVLEVVAVANKS